MPQPTTRTTPNRSSDNSRTSAQVRSKVPIGYNGVPQILSQNYPFTLTDPQTQLPALFPDLSDLPSQTASISNQQFCHNAPEDRQTNRWLTGMFNNYRLLTLYRKRHARQQYKKTKMPAIKEPTKYPATLIVQNCSTQLTASFS